MSQLRDTFARGDRAASMSLNKRILLGIDVNLSPPTQHALGTVSELLQQSTLDRQLVLLHVIPVPNDLSPTWGKSIGSIRPFPPTMQQRLQAEHTLWKARTILQQQGIASERIVWLQRVGNPADEIVKTAKELGVDSIMIGSRGSSLAQRIRRIVVGSTSRRVLQLAPCPVTLVVPPCKSHARNLVAWYEEAVTRSLREHPGSLLIFTACDVAQKFAPAKRIVGHKEVEAAAIALEQLASNGLLCYQKVKGEVRYLND
jgi:nucleotide-binding universal stress UspA family protein